MTNALILTTTLTAAALLGCGNADDGPNGLPAEPLPSPPGRPAAPPSVSENRYCAVRLKGDPPITKESLSSYNRDTVDADLARLNTSITDGSRWLISHVIWDDNTPPGLRSVAFSVFKSARSWDSITVEGALADVDCDPQQLTSNGVYRLYEALTIFADEEAKRPACTLKAGTELPQSIFGGGAAFWTVAFADPPPGCEELAPLRPYRMSSFGIPGYSLIQR